MTAPHGLFPGSIRDTLGAYAPAGPLSPTQFYRGTQPRIGLYDSASDTGQVALATGVMTSVPVYLAAGDVVTNINVRSGATAANGPTNQWAALYSNAATPALLAQSTDRTTEAWAANTTRVFALATAQTISVSGVYWIGLMVAASTAVPTLLGSVAVAPVVTGERNLSQSSGSGLTTTAPATIATPTVKQFAPFFVIN